MHCTFCGSKLDWPLTQFVITGRAIGVVSGEGKPGSLNFDLEDDILGHDGSKALLEAIKTGKLGAIIP